jgi:cAMP phosphodiesterase
MSRQQTPTRSRQFCAPPCRSLCKVARRDHFGDFNTKFIQGARPVFTVFSLCSVQSESVQHSLCLKVEFVSETTLKCFFLGHESHAVWQICTWIPCRLVDMYQICSEYYSSTCHTTQPNTVRCIAPRYFTLQCHAEHCYMLRSLVISSPGIHIKVTLYKTELAIHVLNKST